MASLDSNNEDFAIFYRRNYLFVYRVCYLYMKNAAEAEDCAEDVFVKVLNKHLTFPDERSEKAWLSVVGANVCKDKLKSWKRKAIVSLDQYENKAVTFDATDETLQAVLELPFKYKEVIILYYYQGYRSAEIAKMLQKTPAAIRNRLKTARERLKAKLGDDFK